MSAKKDKEERKYQRRVQEIRGQGIVYTGTSLMAFVLQILLHVHFGPREVSVRRDYPFSQREINNMDTCGEPGRGQAVARRAALLDMVCSYHYDEKGPYHEAHRKYMLGAYESRPAPERYLIYILGLAIRWSIYILLGALFVIAERGYV